MGEDEYRLANDLIRVLENIEEALERIITVQIDIAKALGAYPDKWIVGPRDKPS